MSGEKLVELCERLRLAAAEADEMTQLVVDAAGSAAGKYAGRRVRAEHSDAMTRTKAMLTTTFTGLASAFAGFATNPRTSPMTRQDKSAPVGVGEDLFGGGEPE